jgi:hypothetical protein
MFDTLVKFQTLVVGLIGFAGVIITMVVNAKTQRSLQSRQREHDAKALRVAILAELNENVAMYEIRIQDLSDADANRHALIPSIVVNRIYQALLPKIGMLSAKEVEVVHRAYLSLEEMPWRLRILVGTDNVGGLNNEFIRIDPNRQKVAAEIHKAVLPSVRNAVCVLEENA